MKDLLSYIVQSLVTKPEAVSIDEQSVKGDVDLNLTVDPQDMGLIIGKNGQTIRAIRKLLTVRAIAENVRVNLQLVEPAGSMNKFFPSEINSESEPQGESKEQEKA